MIFLDTIWGQKNFATRNNASCMNFVERLAQDESHVCSTNLEYLDKMNIMELQELLSDPNKLAAIM